MKNIISPIVSDCQTLQPQQVEKPFCAVGTFIMEEIWKDVVDYEGLYQVSNKGRVRSFYKWHGTENRILKEGSTDLNYKLVVLTKNKIPQTRFVHRLVMMAFVGKSELFVDHINNNPSDNRLENLQYLTARQNNNKYRSETKAGRSSKYLGVSWAKNMKKWCARIEIEKQHYTIGYFNSEEDASFEFQKVSNTIKTEGVEAGKLLVSKRVKSSKYKGVIYVKAGRKNWLSRIIINGKQKHLGYFATEDEAYIAYQKQLKK